MFKNEVTHTISCREASSVMGSSSSGLFTCSMMEIANVMGSLPQSPRCSDQTEADAAVESVASAQVSFPHRWCGTSPQFGLSLRAGGSWPPAGSRN